MNTQTQIKNIKNKMESINIIINKHENSIKKCENEIRECENELSIKLNELNENNKKIRELESMLYKDGPSHHIIM